MTAGPVTVFVIDDDIDVRDGLSRLLRSAGWRVESFASAREFLDGGCGHGIGCILLDVNMPGMTGPDLHDHLRDAGVQMPIIYLTGQATVSVGVDAMKKGAIDFLEKPVDEDALLPTVELACARHRRAFERSDTLRDIEARLLRLSVREREVMERVIAGRLNKQIAGDLGIAEKTVKVHRGRAMAKMKVRSVAELVHLWDMRPPAEAV